MKLSSISGLVYAATDLDATAKFYDSLGFRAGKRDDQELTVYVNWFWLTFTLTPDHTPVEGPALYLKVDDIAETHEAVVSAGFTPLGEPQKTRSGRKEFSLLDPNGHKLTFFTK